VLIQIPEWFRKIKTKLFKGIKTKFYTRLASGQQRKIRHEWATSGRETYN
jgi:hypothetical protein